MTGDFIRLETFMQDDGQIIVRDRKTKQQVYGLERFDIRHAKTEKGHIRKVDIRFSEPVIREVERDK